MTTPQRPASVPEDAWFATDVDWFDGAGGQGSHGTRLTGWQLGETGPTGRTGSWRYWAPDGRLVGDGSFVDDTLHGQCRTFHDDGTIAYDNVWEQGRRRLVRQFRSLNPTSIETDLDQFPETAWGGDWVFDDAGYCIQDMIYDRDGRQVDPDGNRVTRPGNVPTATRLRLVAQSPKKTVHCSDGVTVVRTEPGGDALRWAASRWDWNAERFCGPRLDWNTDGDLVAVGYYDLRGRLTRIDRENPDDKGNPLLVAARCGDDAGIETLIDHGAGASPHAAEHADFEGLHDLARRIRAADHPTDGIVDPREEPKRPEPVPADASWVPGLAGWLRFEVGEQGNPVGTWTWWENDDNPWIVEVEFTDARRAVRTKKLGSGRISEQQVYAPDGSVRISRNYDRGELEKETEVLADGSVAERRFYGGGTRKAERVTVDDSLVVEQWWRADGTLAGVVRPTDQVVRGEALTGRDPGYTAFVARLTDEDDADQPVVGEWWQAFDTAGVPIAEGPVRPGLDGKAVETWNLLNPDGTQRATVELGRCRHSRRADLGEFAVEVGLWPAQPPAYLAGVDDVKWETLDSGFGLVAAKDYPRYLTAMTVPGGALARWAFYELYDECLHQNTVYDVTGPVVRYLCQILAAGVHQGTEVERGLLEFVADCASASGTFWLASQVRQIVTDSLERPLRKAVKAAGGAACYVEIYRVLAESLTTWRQIVLADPPAPVEARWLALHLMAFAPGAEADQALR
ncbi:MAG: hypothetical protein FWD11_09495, partial [Micrococcales bacterium]|nr:hypothetical protein [Micrococcales bacterium]